MLRSLSTVLMFVTNIKQSRDWYHNFLDMIPIEDCEDFVSFQIGSSFLNLHIADTLSPVSSGGTVAYWIVDDLSITIQKAISLEGKLYRGPFVVKETSQVIAQIQDPFGNVFGLIEANSA